ncbi:MAG: hypothetical protein ACP5PX_00550 [Candidatus Hadarchaeum sp.]|uniref:hypothetical protein n=1 Tax=Candidatus Hadarchaeum sp. TaxID=2883567 RepID=UPI003D0C30C5
MVTVQSVFDNDVNLDLVTLRVVLSRHPEMARLERLDQAVVAAVAEPDFVLAGRYGENLAVKRTGDGPSRGGWLVVPYREGEGVSTVFVTKRMEKMLERRLILWKR